MFRRKAQPKSSTLEDGTSGRSDGEKRVVGRKTERLCMYIAFSFVLMSYWTYEGSKQSFKHIAMPPENNSDTPPSSSSSSSKPVVPDGIVEESIETTDQKKEVAVEMNMEPKNEDTTTEKQEERGKSFIKMNQGIEPNSWKVVDWHSGDAISPEEEAKFNCDFTTFQSAASGKEAQMCVHAFHDFVSARVRRHKRWGDCNVLPELWNAANSGADDGDGANTTAQVKVEEHPADKKKEPVYVEIGANIGSCVMEMLLGTDANIIAFEPHPMNLYNLKKSVSLLDKSYQDRLTLFPIGLGDAHGNSTIYSAKNNMGNSIIGTIIKDYGTQEFNEDLQFTIHVERLDSILDKDMIDVKLVKMDAQGFECRVLEGMGEDLAQTIEVIKFEWATRWLRGQNCTDLFPRLKNYGFDIFRSKEMSTESKMDYAPRGLGVIDFFASRREEDK